MKTVRAQFAWSICTLIFFVAFSSLLWASSNTIQGEFELLDEPSKHEKGKVILFEFADFYCPHCHMFERIIVTKLKEEFGDQLEARLIGFPVMPGKLPTAFEMYEQAVTMGKGPEMKQELFGSIHGKKIEVFDKTIRRLLLKKLELDVDTFEKGLASGIPYRTLEKGKAWGERIKVTHTPTIVIDGNIRVANLTEENLKTIIHSILEQDNNS